MENEKKPKIFVTALLEGWAPDLTGYALAEDGVCVANHISSSENFAKHDMGITSDWQHKKYNAHYPDGYELVWIPGAEIEIHEGWLEACKRNKEQTEVKDEQEA